MSRSQGRRILVVTPNWVGDGVFALPVFAALRRSRPDGRVAALAVPRIEGLLRRCPDVDEVIVYEERGRHAAPWGKVSLVRGLRRAGFDTAILLHGSWTRAFLCFAAGIPRRIGYPTKRGRLLTHRVEPAGEETPRYAVYARLLTALGAAPPWPVGRLRPTVEDVRTVDRLLASETGDPLIVVHVGANWRMKRWPAERFGEVIAALKRRFPKLLAVIPGTGGETPLARTAARVGGEAVRVLTGRTDLGGLIALMERAALVISADSGPLHIAACLGTPVLGLFGPTDPTLTGPRGAGKIRILRKDAGCNRAPCYHLSCPENRCMRCLTCEEVVTAAEEFLTDRSSGGGCHGRG